MQGKRLSNLNYQNILELNLYVDFERSFPRLWIDNRGWMINLLMQGYFRKESLRKEPYAK